MTTGSAAVSWLAPCWLPALTYVAAYATQVGFPDLAAQDPGRQPPDQERYTLF